MKTLVDWNCTYSLNDQLVLRKKYVNQFTKITVYDSFIGLWVINTFNRYHLQYIKSLYFIQNWEQQTQSCPDSSSVWCQKNRTAIYQLYVQLGLAVAAYLKVRLGMPLHIKWLWYFGPLFWQNITAPMSSLTSCLFTVEICAHQLRKLSKLILLLLFIFWGDQLMCPTAL